MGTSEQRPARRGCQKPLYTKDFLVMLCAFQFHERKEPCPNKRCCWGSGICTAALAILGSSVWCFSGLPEGWKIVHDHTSLVKTKAE